VLINADCTIYEKESYTRHTVNGVYWNDSRGRTVTKNGAQISDSVVVYIYSDSYVPRAGDTILRGISDFEFDVQSQKTISESMRLFRAAFPDFAVVKTVNDFRFGGLAHIELTAR